MFQIQPTTDSSSLLYTRRRRHQLSSHSQSHLTLALSLFLLLLTSPLILTHTLGQPFTWSQTLAASSLTQLQLYDGTTTTGTPTWIGEYDNSTNGIWIPNPTPPTTGPLVPQVAWPGLLANFTSLPSELNSYVSTNTTGYTKDLLILVASGVWYTIPFSTRPLKQYISSSFVCQPNLDSLAFRDRPLKCEGLSSTTVFEMNITATLTEDSNGELYPITFTLSYKSDTLNPSSQFLSDASTVFFHHVVSYLQQYESVQATEHQNTRRRDLARIAVGFLWFFAGCVMLFLCIITAAFQSWYLPIFPYPYALYIWMLLLFGLTIGISIGTGIAGFLILLLVYGAYSCFVGVVYYIHRLRNRETPPSYLESEQKTLLKTKKDESAPAPTNDAAASTPHMVQPKGTAAASPKPKMRSPLSPIPQPSRLEVEDGSSDTVHPYAQKPDRMGFIQRRWLGFTSMLFLTCFVLCVALFGIWRVKDYWVIDRLNYLPSQNHQVEYIPQTIAKSVEAIYAFDGYASSLHLDNMFFHVGTEWCGAHYSAELTSDDDRYKAIQINYVEKYHIDMSLFVPDSYSQYSSVNNWFIRDFNTTFRPVTPGADVISSPAEARVTIWNNNPEGVKFWIKGDSFTMEEFLTTEGSPELFNGGTLVLLRLAPQDYHQFHAVLPSTLTARFKVEGSLQSVNSDGMTSKNYAIYNQRTVMLFNSSLVGQFAYVAIGALCVGSVRVPSPNDTSVEADLGTQYTRGQKLGYFQFGGSTIALVFQKGTVRFEDDIVFSSRRKVETVVQVNSRLGVGIDLSKLINSDLVAT